MHVNHQHHDFYTLALTAHIAYVDQTGREWSALKIFKVISVVVLLTSYYREHLCYRRRRQPVSVVCGRVI